ncbi:hypothetical protein BM1_02025 [Bipolaris maydis]|nr:hypothetical protein BM1_02025 [Bipolaris maydis]
MVQFKEGDMGWINNLVWTELLTHALAVCALLLSVKWIWGRRQQRQVPPKPTARHENGLKILYYPKENEPTVDIVAVHGRGAHADHTWSTLRNESDNKKPSDYINWLSDPTMLPAVLPNASIMRYGYSSAFFGHDRYSASAENVAKALLEELQVFRQTSPQRPLVFVAHSFGGLVVLRTLTKAYQICPDIPYFTIGMIFFGTPFRGTSEETIEMILDLLCESHGEDRVLSSELRASVEGHEPLNRLVNDYLEQARKLPMPRIYCIYEQQHTNIDKFDKNGKRHLTMWVPESLATLEISATTDTWPRWKDHLQLNKYNKIDEDFRKLTTFFKEIVKDGSRIIKKRKQIEIMREFFEGNESKLAVVTISGPRGIGKSSLAKKFASECSLGDDLVIYLDAQTQETFDKSSSDFLAQSGWNGQTVLDFLVMESPWILVLDNVYSNPGTPDAAYVKELLDKLGTLAVGKVVMTTWRAAATMEVLRDWQNHQPIHLQGLDRPSSDALFQSSYRGDQKPEMSLSEVQDLLEILGGHPLSISLVASYISKLSIQPSAYVRHFKDKLRSSKGYSGEVAASMTDYEKTLEASLYHIWNDSVEAIRTKSQDAISILGIWSLLHAKDFSFEFIQYYNEIEGSQIAIRRIVGDGPIGIPTIEFSNAMAVLRDFSIISLDTSTSTTSYGIPGVFHNWCREFLMPDPHKDMLLSVIQCLGMLVPHRKRQDYKSQTIKLLPHAAAVRNRFVILRNLRDDTINGKKVKTSPRRAQGAASPTVNEFYINQFYAFANFAQIFRAHGRFQRAKTVLQWANLILKDVPKCHKEWAKAACSYNEEMGNLSKNLENHKEALEFFNKALESCIEENGEDDDSVLDIRSNLGSAYTKLGQFCAAENEFQMVLACAVTSEHAEKRNIDCKQRYAALLNQWGVERGREAFKKALKYNKEVFDASKRLYEHDKNDYRIPQAACNLASTHVRLSNTASNSVRIRHLQDAERLYNEYVPILEERMPGSNLLHTVQVGYAAALYRLLKFNDAETLLSKAGEGFERCNEAGKESTDYGRVLITQGDMRVHQRRLSDAERLYNLAKKISGIDKGTIQSRLDRVNRLRNREAS